jgi:hypothetical protein
MGMLARICLVLAVAATVHADDGIRMRVEGEHEPLLHIDPALRPKLEGLGAVEDTRETVVPIGANARAVLEGAWWDNQDRDLRHPLTDVPGRGWRASLRLERQLGPLTFVLGATLADVDSRYGSGHYYDLGIGLGRVFKLSRWMTAWIMLTAGRRHWLTDRPIAGEPIDDTTVMLTIGTTFR